jgi:uncharacterized membrane protein YbhN (UPF0104 family)
MRKTFLNPKILLSFLLSTGLLTFVLTFADASQVFTEIAIDVPQVALPVALLTLLYLLVKGVVWWIHLTRLGITIRWQEVLVPFAGGELGNNLPLGVYVENILLKAMLGASIWQSSAATTWMLLMEIGICCLLLLVAGVPGWVWLRPLLVFVVVGMLLVGWVFFKTGLVSERLRRWRPRQQWLRVGVEGATQFWESGRQLFSWMTFLYGLPLTTLYLGAYAAIVYVIGKNLLPSFTWQAASAAYAASVLVVLLLSFVPNLGSVEAAGMAVLLQFGLEKNLAVSIFLIMRALTTGTIALVCVLVMIVCYRQVGQMFKYFSYQQVHTDATDQR